MKKAIVINPDGTTESVDLDTGDELSLLQSAVGGYVQAVYPNQATTLWCNEDGKMLGLPVNHTATQLWRTLHPAVTDVLQGVVVVTGGDDGRGDTLAVTSETEALLGAL